LQKSYSLSIVGKVRDIGFRALIEQAGRIFNLSGIVFNSRDGSVKILCRGEDNIVDLFSDDIRFGAIQRKIIIQDIYKEEIPFEIFLPYPFSRVLADEDIDIGRKLDKGIELLTAIGVGIDNLNAKFDTFNTKFDLFIDGQTGHNQRLEKILEKLAER